MQPKLDDLAALAVVAKERSFTRAAALLGVSPSALSQSVKALEARLGVRLLARTTRSVAPTQAGDRLLATVAPRLEEIEQALASIVGDRSRAAGRIRLTAGEHAVRAVLQPGLARLLPHYPDIGVEVIVDNGLTDIVAAGFDAGIRLGEQVDRDMVALRIGPDLRMAVVGSPDYFARHPRPETPQDLTAHNCICTRLPTYGGVFPWEFEKDGRAVRARVGGQLVLNAIAPRVESALQGLGLAFMPDDVVADHLSAGRLVRVLDAWCPPFTGYHLYYPSRRQHSPAFALLLEALRHVA